jgi:hypothetical protein
VAAAAVSTDHDSCGKALLLSLTEVSADATDCAVLEYQVVDVELFPDCCAGSRRSVDQNPVENSPSWCVRRGETIDWPGYAVDDDRSEIEAVVLYRRAAGSQHRVQQSPAIECRHVGSVDDMS